MNGVTGVVGCSVSSPSIVGGGASDSCARLSDSFSVYSPASDCLGDEPP